MDYTQHLIDERRRQREERRQGSRKVNAHIVAKQQALEEELDRETETALRASGLPPGGYNYKEHLREGGSLTATAPSGGDGEPAGGVTLPNRHITRGAQHIAGHDVATGEPVRSIVNDHTGALSDGLEMYRKSSTDSVAGHPVEDIKALNRVAYAFIEDGGTYGDFAASLPESISDDHRRLAWRSAQAVRTRQDLETYLAEMPESIPQDDPEALYFKQKVDVEALPYVPGYTAAVRDVYRHWEGKEFEGTDEELVDFGLELMSMFNTNFAVQGGLVLRALQGPPEFKQGLYDMMVVDQNTAMTWGHFGRGVIGWATDPTTYLTFGAAAQAAKAPAKTMLMRMLRASLGGAAVAGPEAGVTTTIDDYFRQKVEVEAGTREGIDLGRLGTSTLVGVGAGALLGGTMGAGAEAAGPAIKWAARQVADARARYKTDPAGALFPDVLGGVEGKVGKDIKADAARAERKVTTGQKVDDNDVKAMLADSVDEVRGPVQRKVQKIIDYLRKYLNREAHVGRHVNKPRVIKDKAGNDLPIGPTPTKVWAERAYRVLGGSQGIKEAAQWYGEIRDIFIGHFGPEEGEAYMTAWLMSNQNVNPAQALMNALRVREQVESGAVGKQGGLSHPTVQAFWEGRPTEKGLGPKLFDFVDSALGKHARTYMGDTRAGGHPVVVDIWTARDAGLLDDVWLRWTKENAANPRQVQKLKHDIAKDSSISNEQYEYVADYMRNLTDDLNRMKWQGRDDWRPHEVQAVGWMTMGRLDGGEPYDALGSIQANQRQISYELDFGEGAPLATKFPELAGLPYAQKMAVTAEVMEAAHEIALDIVKPAVPIQFYGPGGWMKDVNPSGQSMMTSSREAAIDYADIMGYLAQQTSVVVTRVNPKGSHEAIDLISDALADGPTATEFWRRLGEIDERITTGFCPIVTKDGRQGIRICRLSAGKKEAEFIRTTAKEAIAKVAVDMDIDIDGKFIGVETYFRGNNWKEDPSGKGYLDEGHPKSNKDDWQPSFRERYGEETIRALDSVHSPRLESRIAAAIQKYPPPKAPKEVKATKPAPPAVKPAVKKKKPPAKKKAAGDKPPAKKKNMARTEAAILKRQQAGETPETSKKLAEMMDRVNGTDLVAKYHPPPWRAPSPKLQQLYKEYFDATGSQQREHVRRKIEKETSQ